MRYFAVVGITLHVIAGLLLFWQAVEFALDRSCKTGCGRCGWSTTGPAFWVTRPRVRWHQRKAHGLALTLGARVRRGQVRP